MRAEGTRGNEHISKVEIPPDKKPPEIGLFWIGCGFHSVLLHSDLEQFRVH